MHSYDTGEKKTGAMSPPDRAEVAATPPPPPFDRFKAAWLPDGFQNFE
jgi:hypothetical protein